MFPLDLGCKTCRAIEYIVCVMQRVHGSNRLATVLFWFLLRYRVRARDARIRVMRRTTLTSTCKNEAVEPRTIVNIVRFLGGVMY